MKTTMRMTKGPTAPVICAFLMLLTFGVVTAFAAGATLGENEAVWGKAVGIQKLGNGLEKRYYSDANTMKVGLRYFVYKDGRVIEDGVASLGSSPEVKKANNKELTLGVVTAFAGGATLKENEALWGKAVGIQKLGNGLEKRFYSDANTMKVGLRCFVYKDGRVIEDSVVSLGSKPEVKQTDNKELAFGAVTTFSAGATLGENEAVWGKTVLSQKLNGGLEKRVHGYSNSMNVPLHYSLYKDGRVIEEGLVPNSSLAPASTSGGAQP